MSPSAGSLFCYWWFFNLRIFYSYLFLGACSISSNCDASWVTTADRNWSVWMQRLISASTHSMSTNHSRYRSFFVFLKGLTRVHIHEIGECTLPAGIPTNPAKPAGYSVRMEASVPLVTQAPPIQPLQIRPGVITQVKMRHGAKTTRDALLPRGGLANTSDRQWYVCVEMWTLRYACLLFFFGQITRPGPTVHSRSWCLLGSRSHQCPRLQPLLTLWWDRRDWLIGGKPFISGYHMSTPLFVTGSLCFLSMLTRKANLATLVMSLCTPLGADAPKWCNTFALLHVNDQWVIGVLWDQQRVGPFWLWRW